MIRQMHSRVGAADALSMWESQTDGKHKADGIRSLRLTDLHGRIAEEDPRAFHVDVEGCPFGDLDRVAERNG